MDVNSILESLQSAQSALTEIENDDTWQELSTSDEVYPDLIDNFNDTVHYLNETISNIQQQVDKENSEQ